LKPKAASAAGTLIVSAKSAAEDRISDGKPSLRLSVAVNWLKPKKDAAFAGACSGHREWKPYSRTTLLALFDGASAANFNFP
jgi:hypothetical protein